ncbi:MAG: SRPBCC domain-containing protein [Bacteroidia bacterium]|nr:SRPBCC domain-containing protein [Bacteroidia bacterium]
MEKIKMSITLPVKAKELYDAWLDSKKHSAFTGGDANVSKKLNGEFTAWDEYISGKNIELKEGKFVKQSWRTMEFKSNAPDSILELTFEEKAGKTKLSLYHYGLQKGDGKKYGQGWKDHYFEPMKAYFSSK